MDIKIEAVSWKEAKEEYFKAYGFLTWRVGEKVLVPAGCKEAYDGLNDIFNELVVLMAEEAKLNHQDCWSWPDDIIFSSGKVLNCFRGAREIVQKAPQKIKGIGC